MHIVLDGAVVEIIVIFAADRRLSTLHLRKIASPCFQYPRGRTTTAKPRRRRHFLFIDYFRLKNFSIDAPARAEGIKCLMATKKYVPGDVIRGLLR